MDAILELDVQADGNGMVHLTVGQPYARVHVTVGAPAQPDETAARIRAAWDLAAAHFETLGLTEAELDAELAADKAERARLRANGG